MWLFAPAKFTWPLKSLLPSRGMTLRSTPAVSASPNPPEVLSTTSCAPATFGVLPPPALPPAHPVLLPSLWVRESLPRPPWIEPAPPVCPPVMPPLSPLPRSEEHTSELQSQSNLVCRLLL